MLGFGAWFEPNRVATKGADGVARSHARAGRFASRSQERGPLREARLRAAHNRPGTLLTLPCGNDGAARNRAKERDRQLRRA